MNYENETSFKVYLKTTKLTQGTTPLSTIFWLYLVGDLCWPSLKIDSSLISQSVLNYFLRHFFYFICILNLDTTLSKKYLVVRVVFTEFPETPHCLLSLTNPVRHCEEMSLSVMCQDRQTTERLYTLVTSEGLKYPPLSFKRVKNKKPKLNKFCDIPHSFCTDTHSPRSTHWLNFEDVTSLKSQSVRVQTRDRDGDRHTG